MQRIMKFPCKNLECGDFNVTKESGQGYAENKVCWFRSEYKSKGNFQMELDDMCSKCINGTLIPRNI